MFWISSIVCIQAFQAVLELCLCICIIPNSRVRQAEQEVSYMIAFIVMERFGERCHRIVEVSESCFDQTFVHGKDALAFQV